MGSHNPCTIMKLSKILLLVSSIAAAPQSSFPSIPVDRFVEKVQGENYLTDNRVEVAVSSKSPSPAAALAYVNSVVKEGLCGEAAEAYVKSILNGGSKEAAVGEATKAYITAFNSGERYEKGGACEASAKAWNNARLSGSQDHVLEATLAFIKKWPGVKDGNPCAIAGTDYVKEILAGKSHIEANSAAMKGFIKAFKEKANKGASLNDEACHKASRAFFDAVPTKSDPVIGAGFAAFSDKLFAGKGVVYDPVCLEAMETFIDSHAAGEDLLTSNLKAARPLLPTLRQFQQTLLVPLLHSHLHKQSVKSQAVQLMLLCLLILMKPSGRETECLTLCVEQPPWHTGMLSLRRRMRLLLVRLQLWPILVH